MTLDEYLASSDPNVFWKLSSGEHQNLLEEAIERMRYMPYTDEPLNCTLDNLKKDGKRGGRAQVLIEDEGVYLYAHGGSNIVKTVRKALAKKQQWDDAEYLARIIFDTMIGNDQGSFIGYGIGKDKHCDIHTLVKVNCAKQTITIGKKTESFLDFVSNKTVGDKPTPQKPRR